MDMAALEDEAEHMVATIGEQSCDITALTSQILRLTTELERTERERQDLRAAKSECVCVLYCVVLCARARRLPAPLSSVFFLFSLS